MAPQHMFLHAEASPLQDQVLSSGMEMQRSAATEWGESASCFMGVTVRILWQNLSEAASG